MELLLANPRGFCAGVDRAIEIVERALTLFDPPIYVRHEVVHNRYVVENLRKKGAVFVEKLDDIPDDSIVIFSAHGVPKSVQDAAKQRKLKIFDATCPLVTKVHLEVSRHAKEGREVVLIGHAGHPEVEGTMGQYDSRFGGAIYLVESPQDVATLTIKNPQRLSYVTQTTLSMDDTRIIIDALRKAFPDITGPRKDDICYATQNRQDVVKQLAAECDLVLVVGSPNSSNSNRLKELAKKMGCTSYLIDSADDLNSDWLKGIQKIGVTAGASAPEVLVEAVLKKLKSLGVTHALEKKTVEESVVFALPKELRKAAQTTRPT
jgi:4-hydroxy-3-methylbut-2-enyl diphosphate reductase